MYNNADINMSNYSYLELIMDALYCDFNDYNYITLFKWHVNGML